MTLDAPDPFCLEFPEAASIARGLRRERKQKIEARAIARRSAKAYRRASSEAMLAALLPARLAVGTSYHVISGGDVDALSYLAHIVRSQPLDYALISSWVLAMEDAEAIEAWLKAGTIGTLDLYVGEIFPNQYPDVFERVQRTIADHGRGRVVVFRNHSKIIAGMHEQSAFYFASESSANVNTNPRTEQTTTHICEDLFWFYKDFFDAIHTIHRNP
ncbi:MAG: hypothetical protein ACREU9_00145 [Gammaproteobacteria bacterium]